MFSYLFYFVALLCLVFPFISSQLINRSNLLSSEKTSTLSVLEKRSLKKTTIAE